MILLLVLIPLFFAGLVLFLKDKVLLRAASIFGAFLPLALVLFFLLEFPKTGPGFRFYIEFPWLPALGINFQAGLDGINLVLCFLHALVSFAGVFFAVKTEKRLKEFLFFYLVLVGAMYGVFTSLNLFFLYLFYEFTLIPLYPMIGLWGSGSTRPTLTRRPCSPSVAANHPEQANEVSASREITKEYGAMKLTLFITSGAVLGLFGILLLYKELRTFDLIQIVGAGFPRPDPGVGTAPLRTEIQNILAPLFLIGFGVIASLWPLHSWSPIGYAAAPTSVSMLHAGVLKKMGPYLILRLAFGLAPQGVQHWAGILALLATIGIIYAGYAAMKQRDLKFMIGFSSVSHMGYVLLGLAAMTPTSVSGSVLLMFSHGVMAAATFGLIGFLYEQAHVRDISDFGGLATKLPFFSICFVMAALASLGLPGFVNFAAELLIFVGSWKSFPILVGFAVFGILITAIYLLRAIQKMLFGPWNERWSSLRDTVSFSDRIPFILLLGALLLFGFWPQGLLQFIRPAVEGLLS